jgi:hypothetical protein
MEAPEQTWAKMEVHFIDYVAGPLWERLAQVRVNVGKTDMGRRGGGCKLRWTAGLPAHGGS